MHQMKMTEMKPNIIVLFWNRMEDDIDYFYEKKFAKKNENLNFCCNFNKKISNKFKYISENGKFKFK